MSAKPAAVEEIAEEKPKKSGNLLIIILIVLVVLLIGAVGFLAFMIMNQSHGEKSAEHAEPAAVEPYKPEDKAKAYSPNFKQFPSPAPGAPAQYFDLEQMVVGFKGEGKAKHLAVKVKMKTAYPEVITELTNIKPILINNITAALRKKTYTEMSADDAQELLADEILKISRAALEEEKVYPDLLDKVLIERFVMQ
ncbi:MAG: flagellar basal body-associated FliL family protein [Gammaproteobacteria bacterium]|nr:flagellar basal body-associated FliL family protein [Gammaproteobacteria bacterium]